MKKLLAFSIASVLSFSALAATELTLPGEKWLGEFAGYVCDDSGVTVSRPSTLEAMNVIFERVTTDSTLDNALLKATFQENGITCRYNAIIFGDNTARTSKLLQSIAFNPAATNGAAYMECMNGKAMLDAAFASGDYLYYGHPHHLAFMVPMAEAEALCGAGQQFVGIDFTVKGKVPAK